MSLHWKGVALSFRGTISFKWRLNASAIRLSQSLFCSFWWLTFFPWVSLGLFPPDSVSADLLKSLVPYPSITLILYYFEPSVPSWAQWGCWGQDLQLPWLQYSSTSPRMKPRVLVSITLTVNVLWIRKILPFFEYLLCVPTNRDFSHLFSPNPYSIQDRGHY